MQNVVHTFTFVHFSKKKVYSYHEMLKEIYDPKEIGNHYHTFCFSLMQTKIAFT